MMMDLPALIQARMPEATGAAGPHDPMLRQDSVVHGFLHVSTNFLDTWARRDFGASLATMLELAGSAP